MMPASSPSVWMIRCSFSRKDEALAAAHILIEAQLIACANMHADIVSVYPWDGAIMQENEVILIAKTSADCVDAAMKKLKEYHSYDVPAITSCPIKADENYAQWLTANVKPPS